MSIKTELNKIGYDYEEKLDSENKKYYSLLEKCEDSTSGFRECGVFYKKKDLKEAVHYKPMA